MGDPYAPRLWSGGLAASAAMAIVLLAGLPAARGPIGWTPRANLTELRSLGAAREYAKRGLGGLACGGAGSVPGGSPPAAAPMPAAAAVPPASRGLCGQADSPGPLGVSNRWLGVTRLARSMYFGGDATGAAGLARLRGSPMGLAAHLGEVADRLADQQAAGEFYRAAVERGAVLSLPANLRLAEIEAAEGRTDAALERIAGTKLRFPASHQPHYAQGLVLYQLGDWRGAENSLLAALDRNREDPYVFYYIALAQARLQRVDSAAGNMDRAAALMARPPCDWLAIAADLYAMAGNQRRAGELRNLVLAHCT